MAVIYLHTQLIRNAVIVAVPTGRVNVLDGVCCRNTRHRHWLFAPQHM